MPDPAPRLARPLAALLSALLPAVLAAAAGCHAEATVAPAGVAGAYALRTVNGAALPHTEYADALTGETYQVVADTIVLGRTGRYRMRQWTRLRRPAARLDTLYRLESASRFTLEDSVVVFLSPPCPPQHACDPDPLPPPRAIVSGGRLTLTDRVPAGRVRAYERVGR
jgi:hypothetical protein